MSASSHDRMSMNYNPIWGVLIMIVASIFVGYYLSMTIILRKNKTNNRNKLYQGLLMGFWMGLIELLMVGFLMKTWLSGFTFILIFLVVGIALFTYLIYYQIGINENQFILSMQEHHSMGIAMAELAKPKTTDSEYRTKEALVWYISWRARPICRTLRLFL